MQEKTATKLFFFSHYHELRHLWSAYKSINDEQVHILCELDLYKYLAPHFRPSDSVDVFCLREALPTFGNFWRTIKAVTRRKSIVHLNTLNLAGDENFIPMTRFRVSESTSWSPIVPMRRRLFSTELNRKNKWLWRRMAYYLLVAFLARTTIARYSYDYLEWIGPKLVEHRRGTVDKLLDLPKFDLAKKAILLELGKWDTFPYTDLDLPATIEKIRNYLRPFEPIFLKLHPSYRGDTGSYFSFAEIPHFVPSEACIGPTTRVFFGYPSSTLQACRDAICLESLFVFRSERAYLAHKNLLVEREAYAQEFLGVKKIRYADVPVQ